MPSTVTLALHLFAAFLLESPASLLGTENQLLNADAVMARVAANQDRSDKLRSEYVYKQHIHIATRKTGGKLMREETTDYVVVPTANGTKKELKLITGRYWHKGKYLEFHGEPVPEPDSLDGDLIQDFRSDLQDDRSKDGFARDYFPLTSEEQKKYQFRLLGEETLQERRVYHLGFRPKDKEEYDWAGEAYIDATDFEPVTVFTKLSRPLPFWSERCWSTCPASDLTCNTAANRTASGSPPASAQNSASDCSPSLAATSPYHWKTPPLSTPTLRAG